MNQLVFDGCRPEPLGSYLKALGLFRIVANQLDTTAACGWRSNRLVLWSERTHDEVVELFLHDYRPTPIVSPWNRSSGFHESDNKTGIEPIASSTADRLEGFRDTIRRTRDLVGTSRWATLSKEQQVQLCHNVLSDEATEWIDAAVVLTDAGAAFPPLLGTGGNIGRLDFSNNFMQRLVDGLLLGIGRQAPELDDTTRWLRGALDGSETKVLTDKPIGQFDPGAAGGSNAPEGGPEESQVNPWDYVLAFEGALAFASGTARRMAVGMQGRAAMPFTFEATPAGYASAADGESTKGELWAPLWSRPTSWSEIEHLFREARVEWKGAHARRGVDVALAARTLGIDRGIDGFVRYAFVERMGQAMLAVPLGRVSTSRRCDPRADVLGDLHPWIEAVRSVAQLPQEVRSVLRRVDAAMLAVSREADVASLRDVLVAVAELERAVGQSGRLRDKVRQPLTDFVPRPGTRRSSRRLAAARWVELLDDGTVEFRLALALASSRDIQPTATATATGTGTGTGVPSVAPTGDAAAGDNGGALAATDDRLELNSPAAYLRPLSVTRRGRWTSVGWRPNGRPVVAGLGRVDVVDVLGRLVQRRAVDAPVVRDDPSEGTIVGPRGVDPGFGAARYRVTAPDVVDFILGKTDDRRLSRWLGALLLLDFAQPIAGRIGPGPGRDLPFLTPPAAAVLLPFFHGREIKVSWLRSRSDEEVSPVPSWTNGGRTIGRVAHVVRLRAAPQWPFQLASGRTADAVHDALHRLRVARLIPLVGDVRSLAGAVDSARLLAATAFPLTNSGAADLLSRLTAPDDLPDDTAVSLDEEAIR